MKYTLFAALIVIILLSIFTCPPKSGIAIEDYPVVRIVDGDTFIAKVDGEDERIRLIGVDTPESVHPNKGVEYFALEASAFLGNMLDGESVFFKYDQSNVAANHRDRYGRILAYAYRSCDSLFVNAEILRRGYGHAYTRYPFSLQEDFLKLERDACTQKLGLWAEAGELPALSDSMVFYNPGSNKYHREECRYNTDKSLEIYIEEAMGRDLEPCKVCKP